MVANLRQALKLTRALRCTIKLSFLRGFDSTSWSNLRSGVIFLFSAWKQTTKIKGEGMTAGSCLGALVSFSASLRFAPIRLFWGTNWKWAERSFSCWPNYPSKKGLILESLCQPQRMQFCIRIYTPFISVLKSGNQIIISKCLFLELKFILSKARGRKNNSLD